MKVRWWGKSRKFTRRESLVSVLCIPSRSPLYDPFYDIVTVDGRERGNRKGEKTSTSSSLWHKEGFMIFRDCSRVKHFAAPVIFQPDAPGPSVLHPFTILAKLSRLETPSRVPFLRPYIFIYTWLPMRQPLVSGLTTTRARRSKKSIKKNMALAKNFAVFGCCSCQALVDLVAHPYWLSGQERERDNTPPHEPK